MPLRSMPWEVISRVLPSANQPPAGWTLPIRLLPATFTPDARTRAADPLFLYFTSGTTARPKLVLHTHQSYPVGHLSTMYWIGLRPDDIHLNISSPGWAKHAWSCFFAPWNAGACVFIYNYARFDATAMLAVLERCRVTTLCAPPTVWRMLIQEDLAAFRGRLAIRELIGAGEPLNPEIIDRVQAAWGVTVGTASARLKRPRWSEIPRATSEGGFDGAPASRLRRRAAGRRRLPCGRRRVSIRLDPRPVGLMGGYSGDPAEAIAPAEEIFYRTATWPGAMARGTSGTSVARTTCSNRRTTGSRRSNWSRSPSNIRRSGGGGRAQPRSAASRGTEVLRKPQSRLYRDARPRRRHLRTPTPTAGSVRAHSSTRVRRHSEDDLGKDPAHRPSPARSETTCSQREGRTRICRRRDGERGAVPGHLQRVSGRHQSLGL